MSVHLISMEVAGDLRRRLDVAGLERLRVAQVQHQIATAAADHARPWRRSRERRAADDRYFAALRDLSGGEETTE